MNQAFSLDYFPPMPVLEIQLAVPESSDWSGSCMAIVDTGADFTIVPMDLLRPLNPPVVRPATLSSQWQDSHPVYVKWICDLAR